MTSMQLAWKIRRHAVEMTHISGGSHIGAILSVADIIAVLYSDILRFCPQDPRWPQRDRLILSKGHASVALYAALAEKGFFPPEELLTYYRNGSRLSGHVSHAVPGVEISTGSLGHGLGIGVGMAIAAKKDQKNHRVFTILGDGECNEGSVWESAQTAATCGLNNLIAIVDHNHMQSLDFCERTQYSGSLADKWRAFGWNTLEVNGHDHDALRDALAFLDPGRPTVIIAHTVKGYQIPFMENNILWHYGSPTRDGNTIVLSMPCMLSSPRVQRILIPPTASPIPNCPAQMRMSIRITPWVPLTTPPGSNFRRCIDENRFR